MSAFQKNHLYVGFLILNQLIRCLDDIIQTAYFLLAKRLYKL